ACKDDQSSHPRINSTMLTDQFADFCCIPCRLRQTIFLFSPSSHEQAIAIPKFNLTAPAAKFRLNCEHACRSNQHMIDIEIFADNIVHRPVTMSSQLIQSFGNFELAAFATIQTSKPFIKTPKDDYRRAG